MENYLEINESKGPSVYFTQETEDAIIEYLFTEDKLLRDKIYKEKIYHAFYKLSENIIHTFKFYYTDLNTIEDLKHEVVTFLLEKMHLYSQGKGKAYSYFGTIAKRYLIIYNNNNYKKLQKQGDMDEINEDKVFLDKTIKESEGEVGLEHFLNLYIRYIDKYLYKLFPKKQDAKTADAIIELFRKRENLEIFNKKALYIYIREITEVSTPQITKITKKLNKIRIKLYNEYYRNGYISGL
jgi:hypothetical protein